MIKVLKHKTTKGGRYGVQLIQNPNANYTANYTVVWMTRGVSHGRSTGHTLESGPRVFDRSLAEALRYDGINYCKTIK